MNLYTYRILRLMQGLIYIIKVKVNWLFLTYSNSEYHMNIRRVFIRSLCHYKKAQSATHTRNENASSKSTFLKDLRWCWRKKYICAKRIRRSFDFLIYETFYWSISYLFQIKQAFWLQTILLHLSMNLKNGKIFRTKHRVRGKFCIIRIM